VSARTWIAVALAAVGLRTEPPGAAARFVSDDGLTFDGRRLLAVLQDADAQALRPADYDVMELEDLVRDLQEHEVDPALVEARLAAALEKYARDRSAGRIRAHRVARTWREEERDVLAVLDRIAAEGRFPEGLSELDPPYPEFRALRAAYQRLAATDAWPLVPEGPAIHPGDLAPSERIGALAERLRADDPALDPPIEQAQGLAAYGPPLVVAVERFQSRYGLEPDGVIGARTLSALRRSPEDLARSVAHSLDRWRWMPHQMAAREVRVNVPAFDVALVADGVVRQRMRAIVGQADWPTPQLLDEVQSVVINPPWHVPPSIVRRELAPAAQVDASTLDAFEITSADGSPVDRTVLDWATIDPATLQLKLPPGEENPLGRMKLVLRNDLGIYLHDTSQPELFARSMRALSHGCVRVEDPISLAAFAAGWTAADVDDEITTGKTHAIVPVEAVAVTVGYWTAWVDEAGVLRFAPDVYGYDARMDRASESITRR
jgi:murein L,D-transpeptidase YcbB/YkuD